MLFLTRPCGIEQIGALRRRNEQKDQRREAKKNEIESMIIVRAVPSGICATGPVAPALPQQSGQGDDGRGDAGRDDAGQRPDRLHHAVGADNLLSGTIIAYDASKAD